MINSLLYNCFHYFSKEINFVYASELLKCTENSYIVLLEPVTFHKKYIYCPPETVISPQHAIILHITYMYIRFGFTCVIGLSISEAGRMIEYTRLRTNAVDKKQNKN